MLPLISRVKTLLSWIVIVARMLIVFPEICIVPAGMEHMCVPVLYLWLNCHKSIKMWKNTTRWTLPKHPASVSLTATGYLYYIPHFKDNNNVLCPRKVFFKSLRIIRGWDLLPETISTYFVCLFSFSFPPM